MLGARLAGRQVDHISQFSVEAKNECGYDSDSLFAFMAWTETFFSLTFDLGIQILYTDVR